MFVPKEIALDEKLIKSTAKEWKTLLAAEQPRRPKDDPGPIVAAMIVALVSRGVKGLDYFYAGGWDSVSMIEDGPDLDFSSVIPHRKSMNATSTKRWRARRRSSGSTRFI
ncbi:MAG: hypothetical protein RL591_1510, partial [Planctomycetota bacterium]